MSIRRVALVVHPTRDIDGALGTLRRWTDDEQLELIQLEAQGNKREVADPGAVAASDLVVALGGDGTVLAALRAAAPTGTPVLGVACGSLGAMSAVTAGELEQALDRFRTENWTARPLPALAITSQDGDDWAINDFVVVRRGSGQIAADVSVDGELYVRIAGDGVIIATQLGSSAYAMASGGPVLAARTPAYVVVPLLMHGGNGPPLVVPADATVTVQVDPGYAGYDVEVDGQTRRDVTAANYTFTLDPDRLRLVTFEPAGRGLTALRRRGLITDSPRILARDKRDKRDKRAGREAGDDTP